MAFPQHDDRPYEMRHERVENRLIALFSVRCEECNEKIEVRIDPNLPPEAILQKLRNHAPGWSISARRARDHLCKRCNHPPSKPPKEKLMTVLKPAAPMVPAKDALKPLSPDQKASIRSLLDTHFDDSVGMYLDGYSDQRIGKELDLPHAHVTQIREAAYGPIKVTPELQAVLDTLVLADTAIAEATDANKRAEAAVQAGQKAIVAAQKEVDLVRQRARIAMGATR